MSRVVRKCKTFEFVQVLGVSVVVNTMALYEFEGAATGVTNGILRNAEKVVRVFASFGMPIKLTRALKQRYPRKSA